MITDFCTPYGIENIANLPDGCNAIFIFGSGEYDSYGVSFVAFDEHTNEHNSSQFFANFDPAGITPLGYLKLRDDLVLVPVEAARTIRLKLPEE